MKIYIDISVLTLATFVTGIQRVTREIIVQLLAVPGYEVVLLHFNARENCYFQIDNRAFLQYYVHKSGIKEKMVTKRRIPFESLEKGSVLFDIDAAWMCRVKRSFLYPLVKQNEVKIITHIYDIISLRYPQYCLERGVYNFMDYAAACLQYADGIIVNAKATEDDLNELARELGLQLPPCRVVPLGADYSREAAKPEAKDATGADGANGQTAGSPCSTAEEKTPAQINPEVLKAARSGPYILMVGTIEPRKNHKLVIDAYDRELKEMGYHVIMAGYMGWNMEGFAQRLKEHPDNGTGIFHFEGLDDENVSYLYKNARYLAFCSYSEGFGLPLIESIYRGTPVIASDIPVSGEVAGDYCIYFKQDDVQDFCQKIRETDGDRQAYEAWKARLKQFRAMTWEESGERMRAALADL